MFVPCMTVPGAKHAQPRSCRDQKDRRLRWLPHRTHRAVKRQRGCHENHAASIAGAVT